MSDESASSVLAAWIFIIPLPSRQSICIHSKINIRQTGGIYDCPEQIAHDFFIHTHFDSVTIKLRRNKHREEYDGLRKRTGETSRVMYWRRRQDSASLGTGNSSVVSLYGNH